MTQKQKDAIGKVLNYSFDFDYVDLVKETITRIDNLYDEFEIYEAIDSAFIYYYQQWIIARHFNLSPFEVNRQETLLDFQQDILKIVDELKNA